MVKVEIDGKEVKFSTNALFILKYKQTFGEDVLKVIFPLIKAIVPLAKTSEVLDLDDLSLKDLAIVLPEIIENMEGVELLDLYKILYAMVLAGDKTIGDFEEWLGSFEEFPLFDVIGKVFPELLNSLNSNVQSKKNMQNQTKA